MATGWIRAYAQENQSVGTDITYYNREERAQFRKSFKTALRKTASESADVLQNVKWGTAVELPNGLSNTKWTKVKYRQKEGFILSAHLVEIAYVGLEDKPEKVHLAKMTRDDGEKKGLLWGDLVQITKPGSNKCEVRVRGSHGTMNTVDLKGKKLLELYFIDVGQGDGVLMQTPDGKHMLIDGGLERKNQQTGKNAADFVDWKFFFDYGDYRIDLDSMMASHSDTDHFGGLHDLVRVSEQAERELDCLSVSINTFHHPGLSRWSKIKNANPPHRDGLGPNKDKTFIRLLGDRSDAEQATSSNADLKLSGPWSRFIKALLNNSSRTKFERVLVEREQITSGGTLPKLWSDSDGCSVSTLGPVAKKVDTGIGLPDLGDTGKNSNGHSICLRVDYGAAKILLTGDLNKKSMNWIIESYGDRMGAWECDVAKACHHGSDDISYRFLEKVKAAATIISSGDAEGHAHPRPEIVGASAMTGYKNIDRNKDKLLTPLIYMTEIERSVSLGSINRMDFKNLPSDEGKVQGAIPGRNIDEFGPRDFLNPEQRKELKKLESEQPVDKNKIDRFLRKIKKEQKPLLEAMEEDVQKSRIKVDFNISVPLVPFGSRNVKKRAWRSRLMEKNHYGLVNVRTDGKTIMCATLDETEEGWIVHSFPARF